MAPLLGDLLRSPSDRSEQLACLPLLLRRDGHDHPLPTENMPLARGDEILFAGRLRARRSQQLALANVNALDYVRTGRDLPGGWIWQQLTRRNGQTGPA